MSNSVLCAAYDFLIIGIEDMVFDIFYEKKILFHLSFVTLIWFFY